ncbi:hypothetical protein PV326_007307 [Microctonus aethiopoides]|nr:hypothetical protein PV326_007307 [Microctonus aethiopoides]
MTEEDRHQLRAAAENLLSGSLQSQRSLYPQRSISSINREYIITENLIAGTRPNGRMSNVRRFFCLLITFDLLFTCLMWLICTTIAGENISTAFIEQVLHYRIQSSLFDVVMAAVCRFIILLLFYALLYMDHWIIVALTTTSTCAFTGAKVYFFEWNNVQQPGFQALLIMTSFVLAWAEAWYFDCRVVPQEIQARDWLNSPLMDTVDNERTSLLRNSHYNGPLNRGPENAGNFFTPMDSPTHSDDEEIVPKNLQKTTTDDNFLNVLQTLPSLSEKEIDEYNNKARLLVNQSYELLTSNEWQKLNTTSAGDVVSVLSNDYGKILKIEGVIDAPAIELVDRLYNNIEDMPSWNKDVSLVKKIETINLNTDIIYQSTKTYGAGLIGPRDFITLRHRNKCGNYYMTSGISVKINLPHRKNHVRGENGIVCFATEKFENDDDNNAENKCHVTWILHANLNIWLPQRVIDKSLASTLEKMMGSVRYYVYQSSNTSG